MAIQFGNDKIEEIYFGSDKIQEVHYGSELVWTQVGYWVHKDTGVKTYFGLEESSIVNGIMSSPSWRNDCSEVRIPSGVTGLGSDCFRSSSSLTSITLPKSVTSLDTYSLSYCKALTSITLPESVTSLGDNCFKGCTSLPSINIPESVTNLGIFCFASCTSLTSITLPESVTSLGTYCFRDCSSLILLTVLPAIPPSLGGGSFIGVHTSFNIKVRSPYVDAYKAATNWKTYASKISAI